MTLRVVGLGAGGHARVMIEAIRAASNPPEIVGLLDVDPSRVGTRIDDVPVLGGDAMLRRLFGEGVSHAFVGVGTTSAHERRRQCYERIIEAGLTPLTVVHPRTYVSSSATLGAGVSVMVGAVIQSGAVVAANVLVNSGAVIEHDCRVQEHVHVASGAILAGGVRVGAGAHVGAGAVVRELIEIGPGATVGAGAVVVAPVPAGVVVVGNPARMIRSATLHG